MYSLASVGMHKRALELRYHIHFLEDRSDWGKRVNALLLQRRSMYSLDELIDLLYLLYPGEEMHELEYPQGKNDVLIDASRRAVEAFDSILLALLEIADDEQSTDSNVVTFRELDGELADLFDDCSVFYDDMGSEVHVHFPYEYVSFSEQGVTCYYLPNENILCYVDDEECLFFVEEEEPIYQYLYEQCEKRRPTLALKQTLMQWSEAS